MAICEGDSVLINGNWIKVAGTYINALTNQQGCDSIVTTYLTLKSRPVFSLGPDTTVCNGQAVQFSGPAGTGYTYLWLKDGVPFSTNPIITATQTGIYSLTVTAPNGCSATHSVSYISYPIPGPIQIKHA